MILLNAIYIITGIIPLFAYKIMMDIFFEKRRTPIWVMVLSYVLLWVSVSVEYYFIDTPLTYTLIPLIALFIITLNYESFMMKRLAAVGCIDLVHLAILGIHLFISSIFPALYTFEKEILPSIAGNLLISLFALLLRRFKSIKKDSIDLPVIWIPTLILPISIILTHVLNAVNLPHTEGLLTAVIWLGICFLTFYLYNTLSAAYEDKLKSALHSQEREYYFAQCQLMQESVERMKSFRHDIKIHLATLKDYSVKAKPEDITNYLDGLLEDIEKSEIYSNTGNIAFDSIINYKLKNTKSDNIKLDLRMSVPPVLNVEVVDIVIILGNLLDNALEAVAKVTDKIIKLDIEFSKGGLFVKIDNSFNGEIKYLEEKAVEEKQITSLKDGDGHGYGLKNISQSIKKYNGYMKITHTNKIFSTGVFLYVDDN